MKLKRKDLIITADVDGQHCLDCPFSVDKVSTCRVDHENYALFNTINNQMGNKKSSVIFCENHSITLKPVKP